MKIHDRTPEMYYYEWSVSRWRSSETRARLDAVGRGIYREIMDLCYVQGSIPKDRRILANQVGCSVEQMEAVWTDISHHFYQDKHNQNHLRNKVADVVRTNFFALKRKQKSNASNGGLAKSRRVIEMSASGSSKENRIEKNRSEVKRIEVNRNEEKGKEKKLGAHVCLAAAEQAQILASIHWESVSKATDEQIAAIMKFKADELAEDLSPGSLCMLNAQLWWFQEFWEGYWNKANKKQCRITFCKVVTSADLQDKIMQAIQDQTPAMSARPPDKIPHGSTWLNGARWEDPTGANPVQGSENQWALS